MIRLKKYIKKILIGFTALTGLITAIAVPSLAYSEDSEGNLVSDNLIDNSTSVFELGAVSYNIGRTYSENKVSSNARIRTINLVNVDSTKTYSLSVPSPYLVIAQGYNEGLQVSSTGTQFNQALSNLSFTGVSQVSIIVRKADNSNFASISNISEIKLMFNEGNLKNYELYGQVYYSQDNYNNALLNDYGIFRLCSSIQLKLIYTDSSRVDAYEWDSILSLLNDKSYVKCQNGVFSYNSVSLSSDLLGGSSNATAMWQFNFEGTYPQIKQYSSMIASGYDLRYQIIDTQGNLFVYDNITNNHIVDLMEYQYKQIGYLQLYTGAVGIAVVGTSLYFETNYNVAYTNGYEDGKTQGYDEGYEYGEMIGFENGKNNGYDLGYNQGVEDGEASDFATNGFKTLIGSIFNYPINMIRNVFNFEFMGINIAGLITFIISVVIVIFIVHRFKK